MVTFSGVLNTAVVIRLCVHELERIGFIVSFSVIHRRIWPKSIVCFPVTVHKGADFDHNSYGC